MVDSGYELGGIAAQNAEFFSGIIAWYVGLPDQPHPVAGFFNTGGNAEYSQH